MPQDPHELDPKRIRALLEQLGERLSGRGVTAELYIVGGAAMALAYNARRVTADIDAIIIPSDVILDEASAMAQELGLDADWLNDNVTAVMPNTPDPSPRSLFHAPGIGVLVASPEYLLAMKATTSRMSRQDRSDAALLCRMLGVKSADALMDMVASRAPTAVSLEPRRWFLEEIIQESLRPDPEGVLAAPSAIAGSGGPSGGLCGTWMPRAKSHCALPAGHGGQHRHRRPTP